MHVAGSASWLLDEPDSQLPHVALFARDAVGLTIPTVQDVPPPLAGQIDRRDVLLRPAQHDSATGQWLAWWRQILTYLAEESVPRRSTNDHKHERLRSVARRRRDFFDPPDFAALAGAPELKLAVTATYRDGLKWLEHREPDPGPAGESYETEPPSEHVTPGGFRWTAIRDAAEHLASERGVPVGDLRAVAYVLEVEGLWSYIAGPGCAICSSGTATDPEAADRFLRRAFGSSLL